MSAMRTLRILGLRLRGYRMGYAEVTSTIRDREGRVKEVSEEKNPVAFRMAADGRVTDIRRV
jgi:hypothetical protein